MNSTELTHNLNGLKPLNLNDRHGRYNNSAYVQAIADLNTASLVPANGRVSFRDIAKQAPMTEQMMARVLGTSAQSLEEHYRPYYRNISEAACDLKPGQIS